MSPSPEPPSRAPRLRRAARGLGVFLLVWALWTPVSLLAPPHLAAVDGYFHIKAASFYALRGPLAFSDGRFPWLASSVFADRWSDIEYLFHLAMAPFTLGWQPPPPRVGPVLELERSTATLAPPEALRPGLRLEVRPAEGLAPVAAFEIEALEADGRVRGRLVEILPEAPLHAGFLLSGEAVRGTLVDLGRGRVRLPEDPGLERGALLTLFGPPAYAGRARLDSAGGGEVPFTLVHLRAGAEAALLPGARLELDDHRGFVDPVGDDLAELERFVLSRGEDPGALPAGLRAPRRLLGPDTLAQRGRLAVAFLQALVLFTLGFVLRRNAGGWAWAGAALLVLGSDFFAWRFFMCRPQLLSMSFMLLAWHLALHRRLLPLGLLGALYALAYVAPHALLALVGIVAAVDLVAGGRDGTRAGWWRPVAALAAGIGAGLLVHPNALNHLRLLAVVNVSISSSSFLSPLTGAIARVFDTPLLTAGPKVEAAIEFQQVPGFEALRMFSLWLPALVLFAAFLATRVRPSRPTLAAWAAMLAWWGLFTRSQRFIEYLAPFAALALALAARDLWRAGLPQRLLRLPRALFAPLAAVLGLAALAVAGRAVYGAVDAVRHVVPAPQRESALFLRSHAPRDAQLFETEWDDTVVLLHFNERQRYQVALDPHYLFHFTPDGRAPGEIYGLWNGLVEGRLRLADPRAVSAANPRGERDWIDVLRRDFRAGWVLCLRDRFVVLENLRREPAHFEEVYADAERVLFRVRDPGSEAAGLPAQP